MEGGQLVFPGISLTYVQELYRDSLMRTTFAGFGFLTIAFVRTRTSLWLEF